jgi:hypothetical protein
MDARLIAGRRKAHRLSTLSNRITSYLAQRRVTDATDPARFSSRGLGLVAPNLGNPNEHGQVNRRTVRKADFTSR